MNYERAGGGMVDASAARYAEQIAMSVNVCGTGSSESITVGERRPAGISRAGSSPVRPTNEWIKCR
jgi:hypothetical protein